ncbi:MAG: bifunctional 5,10-methylenetetrahydrofolate dehydrogenase/5,10-methenyltetrahydrofolate cyclohydrolase [Elusimicrobiota bacterium]|nr:bifunctional 5,10-methylenetetrahydrofolate dehydrogenase/5,10-methenyltetrahydrofolate cyclohydrolase [Elusimicrobiota bacterium]
MSAKIIDGNEIAQEIKNSVKSEIEFLSTKYGSKPVLAAIQIGSNPASAVYIKNQKAVCEEVNIEYRLIELIETISEEELSKTIESLTAEEAINGIIVQMPLPKQIDSRRIQMKLPPSKDVEGVTPPNLGMLLYAGVNPIVAPCTAIAVIECLKSIGIKLSGKETVIVGHSEIVGKPVALMLLSSLMDSVTPTVCHIATKDLASHTRRAEILIVAVGKPGLIKGDMVKEGGIVIDVGINRVPVLDEKGQPVIDEKTGKKKMKTVGDVAFDEIVNKVSFITPVPGGVGAVTTAVLLRNLLHLWKMQLGEPNITYTIF